MSEKENAFPSRLDDPGLTKLEYFTAAAMQGHLSNPNMRSTSTSDDKIAAWSVAVAKSTLAQLAKEEGR